MQKIAKLNKTGKGTKEAWIRIDQATASRHETLFLDGDYSRIAERSGSTRHRVSEYLKAGKGPVTVMKAAKGYYAEKAKAQAELNAA